MTTTADRGKAFAYFVGAGWTPAQAAGIVANLVAESNLNPDAVGDGGAAAGVGQWHADRQAGFAALMGKPIQGSSLEDQLAWVHAELQGTEKAAGDALRACTTAAGSGAAVSMFYERPADRVGEAERRGMLAESILQQFQAPQAEPVPEPQPTAAPPQGAPMGAIATFLPLILQLIPALTGIKGLQNVVGAVSGAAPPVPLGPAPASGGSLHAGDYVALAQTILSTFVNAIPAAQGNPALAVGMAQTDPAVAAAAAQAVTTHPDVVAALNAQIPVFDKIAQYDAATNAAQLAGQNAAMVRQAAADPAMLRLVVGNINGQSWLVIGGLIISLIASAICKAVWPNIPDYFMAVLGLAGPIFGQVMKERGAVIAYYFDGTPASNATAAVNQQIAQMNAAKQ